MSNIKKRTLAGDPCTVEVYNNLMRFWVNAGYCSLPDNAEQKAHENRMEIERYQDGSTTVSVQSLIAWDTSDADIERLYDETVNRIEKTLGIGDGCLSSSTWNAGHSERQWDYLLSSEEQAIISQSC